jgi:hypothetical protein
MLVPQRTLPSLDITVLHDFTAGVEVRTLPGGMDALVSDNERVVKSGLAINSKGRDTAVNLDRGGGADESNSRSDEGEHKKKAKRSHVVFRKTEKLESEQRVQGEKV